MTNMNNNNNGIISLSASCHVCDYHAQKEILTWINEEQLLYFNLQPAWCQNSWRIFIYFFFQSMSPNDFGYSLTFHISPPWCCHLWLWLKWLDYRLLWYRLSWSTQVIFSVLNHRNKFIKKINLLTTALPLPPSPQDGLTAFMSR